MPHKNRFLSSFLSVILIFSITLTNVRVAFADEGPTPEPAVTAEPTQPPVEATEPPVEATEPAVQPTLEPTQSSELPTEPAVVSTEVPTQAPAVEENSEPVEQAPITELLSQAPKNTELVVLDENGQALSLTSQEALDTILDTDPMWCPAGVLPGGLGCTTNFLTIGALMTDMMNNTTTYDENGIIYFTANPDTSFSLTTSNLGAADFNTLSSFNLTLQGGWNGSNGALATFTGQTNFAANTLTVGSFGNPWVGNITLNNFTFSGVSGANNAVTVYTDGGDITLDNIDVALQAGTGYTALLDSNSGDIIIQNGSTFGGATTGNNGGHGFSANTDTGSITISGASGSNITFNNSKGQGTNYNGATLSAPTISLSYVTASGNDGNGIEVSNASLVTLNNVTSGPAVNNQGNGLSGVLINGTGSTNAIVSGGVFADNGSYGIEILNGSLYITTSPACPTTGNTKNGLGCYNVPPLTDSTAPVITPIITGTAGSNGWYRSDVTVGWTVTDAESGIKTSTGCTTSALTSETTGVTLTCSATNNVGLSSSASVTIKIDKTNPGITFVNSTPAPNINGWINSNVIVNWSCTDTPSGPASASVSQTISTEGANQSATGTCLDLAGNSASNSQSGFNIDKTGPTLNLPSNMTVEATSSAGAIVNYSASASDNLDAAPGFSCNPASGSAFVMGTTMVNCTATDHANNVAFGNFNVTVQDTTGPVIAFHADVTAEATSATGATVNYTSPATSDVVDGVGVATCSPASGNFFDFGPTIITCNATDSNGNDATPTSFVVHVVDTTAPVIAAHADITVQATSASGAVVTYNSPASSDLVDGAGVASCAPVSGSTFSLGNTNVTCTATDTHNNVAIPTTFVVHVLDTMAPVIAPHGDITAEATSFSGAVVTYTSPATSDIVDGAGVATCSPASGATFALGNTTVTCNATDANGNQAISTTFVVHVVDTTAPIIAPHADVNVAATSPAGAIVNYTSPATSDAVDGAGIATCTPVSGGAFPIGNTTVTCNATDKNGNQATPTSFIVHVIDTAAPVIDGRLDETVEATSAAGAIGTYTSPTTSDAVDGAGVATCSPVSATFFAFGNTTVTCNATDSNGNEATPTSFVVHVVDTTAPVIAAHADVAFTTNNTLGSIVTYSSPATSDVVDGPGIASCSPASGSFFPFGDTLVTCNATDAHGNVAQSTAFNINVNYQAVVIPPTPGSSTPSQGNDLNIPVTGGLLDLDCLTIVDSFGIKVTFHNLCDYQAATADVQADTLPSALPNEYSFIQGLNVLVLFEQQVVKDLPTGAGVQLGFPIPANTQDQFAVVLWDDEDGDGIGQWLDVTQLVKDQELSKILSADPNDELYELAPTKTLETFYRVVTTEKTGTFVLIKK